MPAAYTPSQKAAIQQFASFTQVKDSVAAKTLKAHGWDVNVALNSMPEVAAGRGSKRRRAAETQLAVGAETPPKRRHYASSRSSKPQPSQGPAISKVFDAYRDDPSNPDTIGVDGTMKYLEDIGVSPAEPTMVAVLSVVGSEVIGEIDRNKFVSGWESQNGGAISSVSSMQTAAEHMRAQLSTDPAFFKTVYKHAFLLARAQGQKSVALDMATEFWRLMFGEQGLPWKTKNTDWLELWCTFVTEKWNKSVSRDMWNQLEVFARKTLDDETLGFWSEESSWPTVIDEFVAYAKDKKSEMEL